MFRRRGALTGLRWDQRFGQWLWVLLTVAIVVPFTMAFLAPVMIVNRISGAWLGVAGVPIILAVCGWDLARTDRVAFISLAAPASVLVVVGLFVPRTVGLVLDVAAFAFLGAFSFAGDRVWGTWWRLVLRRPPLPTGWAFWSEMRTHTLRFAQESMIRDRTDPGWIRSVTRDIAHLRGLTAPNAEWAAYRDRLVELETIWIDPGWDGTNRGLSGLERLADLKARYEALTAQPRRDAASTAPSGGDRPSAGELRPGGRRLHD